MSTKENRIAQIKAELAELEKSLAHWESEARVNAGNMQAKDMLPHVTQRVEDTRARLAREIESAELAANPDSQKTKAELKELDQINKTGSKLMDDITKAAIALDGQIRELMNLQLQADRLAMRYEKRPFYSGITMARIQSVGHALARWRQEVQSWERHKEITAAGDQPRTSNKPLIKNERAKMIDERYGKD